MSKTARRRWAVCDAEEWEWLKCDDEDGRELGSAIIEPMKTNRRRRLFASWLRDLADKIEAGQPWKVLEAPPAPKSKSGASS